MATMQYLEKAPHVWERVNDGNALHEATYRMKVPEGWIYKCGGQFVFVHAHSC